MCDYSLEAYRSVKAEVGAKYTFDRDYAHGFIATLGGRAREIVLACVLPGQTLSLTKVTGITTPDPRTGRATALPASFTATVVSRKKAPTKYRHFGPFNDGLEMEDGTSFPVANLMKAEMVVLPEDKDLASEAPKATKKSRARDLVDGDD